MKKADEEKVKADHIHHILCNVQYDVSRLCHLTKYLGIYEVTEDYRKMSEYKMLKERLERLFQALGTLSSTELEMLYLKYEKGLNYRKIGRKMHLAQSSTHEKMRRTLVKLYTAIYEE